MGPSVCTSYPWLMLSSPECPSGKKSESGDRDIVYKRIFSIDRIMYISYKGLTEPLVPWENKTTGYSLVIIIFCFILTTTKCIT